MRIGERHAGKHFRAHDLGRDRREASLGLAAGDIEFDIHADAKVVRVRLRHPDLNFKAREVQHDHQQRVAREFGPVADSDRADDAVDRRADRQFVVAALEFGHHGTLAAQFLGACRLLEADRLGLQFGVGGSVTCADSGGVDGILGFEVVDLRDRAFFVPAFAAHEVAFGGDARDLGFVGGLQGGQAKTLGFDARALARGLQAGQQRAFAFQLGREFGGIDHGQHIALGHRRTGARLERDGPVRRRIQARAVGGDDATVGDRVANQRAAFHFSEAQAAGVDAAFAGEKTDTECDQQKHRRRRSDDYEQMPTPLAGGRGDYAVLGGGISNHGGRPWKYGNHLASLVPFLGD